MQIRFSSILTRFEGGDRRLGGWALSISAGGWRRQRQHSASAKIEDPAEVRGLEEQAGRKPYDAALIINSSKDAEKYGIDRIACLAQVLAIIDHPLQADIDSNPASV